MTKAKELQDKLKAFVIAHPEYAYHTINGTSVVPFESGVAIQDKEGNIYNRVKVCADGTVFYEMVSYDGFLVEDVEYAPIEALEQMMYRLEAEDKEAAREELVHIMLDCCKDETEYSIQAFIEDANITADGSEITSVTYFKNMTDNLCFHSTYRDSNIELCIPEKNIDAYTLRAISKYIAEHEND